MRYEINCTYEFEVNRSYGDDEDFLRVIIPEIGEIQLPKMRFQHHEPLPEKIRCRIKTFYGRTPVLSHFVPDYVNRFYGHAQNTLAALDGYEFNVIGIPEKGKSFYTLEDKYGIRYKLFDNKAYLGFGQKVMCRFDKLTPDFFSIKLVEHGAPAQLYNPYELLRKTGIRPMLAKVMALMVQNLDEAKRDLDRGEPLWVVKALREAVAALSQWYIEAEKHRKRHPRTLRAVVIGVRRVGLYLLESSRFIRNLDLLSRRALQATLTEAVDGLDPIVRAVDIANKRNENQYIESLQRKLGESGYLYHPAMQFSVLMLILRRKPGLVRTYLGRIFDTIMAWPLDTWTTEPFRSAFTGQLEIYIRQASHEIDLFPQADTEFDTDRLEKNITALALQMLIGSEMADQERQRHNRSLFYRYISLQRPLKNDELLLKSLRVLLGERIPLEFNYSTIRQPQALMTSTTLYSYQAKLESVHRFTEWPIEITFSSEGMVMKRTDEENATRMLPNGMMSWLNPQIYVNGIASLGAGQINNLDAHRRMWLSIEKNLFEHRPQLIKNKNIAKRRAEIDDDVLIIFSPQMTVRGDNPRWTVRIDDENFETENGWISREDIVSFNINSTNIDRDREAVNSALIDEKGKPRHFLARVIDVDADGVLHFSLLNDISHQLPEIMNDYDCYSAVIAYTTEYGYSAIAETGYGIHLQRRQQDEYKNGDIVRFHITNRVNSNHIMGVIDGYDDTGRILNKTLAFSNILKAISIVTEDSDSNEPEMLDSEGNLTKEDIREIVEIIRFKAIATSNLLTAFDYLMLARLLALAAGDDRLAKRLLTHAELLRMHQYYATNRRIDADELERRRPEVEGFPLLASVFHRLEIVSWLGDTDRNNDLWETINNSRNHLQATLAQLVLSYNMLPVDCDESISESLKKQIAHTLGLNFEVKQLKSYGSENQFTEFKSSLVYPARKRNEKVAADPEAQQFVILKTIAAFMNSEGGTLYIGVNDKTHCEAGLFEDFEFYKHYRPSDGKIFHNIKNADNLCVFLTNLVCNTWGNVIAGSVQIDIDTEAQKDVIQVNVSPRTLPVSLDNVIYVRRSNNSKALQNRELEEFTSERKALAMSHRKELEEQEQSSQIKEKQAAEITADKQKDEPAVEISETVVRDNPCKLKTSTWRDNVLHNWEEGYVQPAGYIYFGEDNTLQLTTEDRSYDYNEDCLQALVFSTKEAEQGFLMMVFDNNRILKVPMTEIVEKDVDRKIPYYKDANLVFTSIATANDALLMHISDSKGNLSRRVVPLSEFDSQHLTSNALPAVQMPGLNAVTACEIVASSALNKFKGSLTRDLSSRQLGYLLHTMAGTDKAEAVFQEDCKNCRPLNH